MSVVGVHAATVITAVTAQNTCGVDDILPLPEEFIKEQLESVLRDADVKAIKTGMLYLPHRCCKRQNQELRPTFNHFIRTIGQTFKISNMNIVTVIKNISQTFGTML